MADARRLIIIGSGPAGYAAAIYAARAQLKPLVLAGEKGGGQLMLTTEVENYPGFPEGILGPSLMTTMREQAIRFGAEVIDHDVTKVDFSARPFKVWSGHHEHLGGEKHVHPEHIDEIHALPKAEHDTPEELKHEDFDKAEAIILATGAESIPLGVAGEREYSGRGVSYCAVCDAAFFREKRVFVVGGGDAAMEDTLALMKFAKKITILHRRDAFRASKIMQERVLASDKVDVWWNREVLEVKGDGQKIESLMIKNTESKEVKEEAAEGLFVAIGHKPATGFLGGTSGFG
jgi:thioredoxin reductase (NADPH)